MTLTSFKCFFVSRTTLNDFLAFSASEPVLFSQKITVLLPNLNSRLTLAFLGTLSAC